MASPFRLKNPRTSLAREKRGEKGEERKKKKRRERKRVFE
jgi:hypothetical protein